MVLPVDDPADGQDKDKEELDEHSTPVSPVSSPREPPPRPERTRKHMIPSTPPRFAKPPPPKGSTRNDDRFRAQSEDKGQTSWISARKKSHGTPTPEPTLSETDKAFRRTSSAMELSTSTGKLKTVSKTLANSASVAVTRQKSASADTPKTTPRKESRKGTLSLARSFKSKKIKKQKSIITDYSAVQEQEKALEEHQAYHITQKQKGREESLRRLAEEDKNLEDDGKDYGDAVFGVPNFPRFIVMSGNEHYYQIRAATLFKLVERVTCLIPDFFEECKHPQQPSVLFTHHSDVSCRL